MDTAQSVRYNTKTRTRRQLTNIVQEQQLLIDKLVYRVKELESKNRITVPVTGSPTDRLQFMTLKHAFMEFVNEMGFELVYEPGTAGKMVLKETDDE